MLELQTNFINLEKRSVYNRVTYCTCGKKVHFVNVLPMTCDHCNQWVPFVDKYMTDLRRRVEHHVHGV